MTTGETTMFATDFDDLRCGDCYRSEPRPIDARDVSIFASLTGDHHPIHTDPVWARESGPFDGPIAHGMLLLSCAVGVLPLDPDRVLALRRIRDAVFKRPLEVGDVLLVDCRISDLKTVDDAAGLVECEWRLLGADERLRARVTAEILWRRGGRGQTGPVPERLADRHEDGPIDELCPVDTVGGDVRVLI